MGVWLYGEPPRGVTVLVTLVPLPVPKTAPARLAKQIVSKID